MGLTYSDMQRTHNTDGWTVVGGFHTTCLFPTLGTVVGEDQPPAPLWLFEADNNAIAKYASRPMPGDGQNPNISTYWEFWFQFRDTFSDYMNFTIANQQNIQMSSASIRGYCIRVATPSGVAPDATIAILALNGGGGYTNVGSVAWGGDTSLHRVRMSRTINGASRDWRLYFDDMTTPIVGPVNNTTYTNFQWWGYDHFTRPRMICGAEACRS